MRHWSECGGPADPVGQVVRQLGLEPGIRKPVARAALEAFVCSHQRLGHITPAKRPVASVLVRIMSGQQLLECVFALYLRVHQCPRAARTNCMISSGLFCPGVCSTPLETSTP